jgi:AraC-like DNA-binding protein
MESTLSELIDLVGPHARQEFTPTAIPRLSLTRWPEVTGPVPRLVAPRMCLVLQGSKSTSVGGMAMQYGAGGYLISAVEVPVLDHVSQASRAHPFLGLQLAFEPAILASLVRDLLEPTAEEGAAAVDTGQAGPELLDGFVRLMRLMDRPEEIAFIAPLVEREILFRLLQGKQGHRLRQMASPDSHLSQIRRATAWIRDNYARPIKVEDLAVLVGMSPTSFHRHFKAATRMTPIQYQKSFRLHEARQRLLAAPGNTAGVAFAVGYESPSQFSREYARLFGRPPLQDVRSAGARP